MQDSYLTVSLIDSNTNKPLPNATINIYSESDNSSDASKSVYNNLKTDDNGQIKEIILQAPDIEYSLNPTNTVKPYSEYTIEAIIDGYETIIIDGAQLFATIESRQSIPMIKKNRSNMSYSRQNEVVFTISDHTLYGIFPTKIPESSIKPLPAPSGFVVLDNPVVPEYVIVHDGLPEDTSAKNYWIPFKEYIKNVAGSEIYSTWPEQTIYANVVAIISFTLNRVFTEWYKSKGYDYTITSSTAYDQKFVYQRNLFDPINVVVDDIFNTFIKRPPDQRQPLLAMYCDGQRTQCPNQLTQWGSKELGDQGYTWQNILKYYYGNEIAFSTAPVVTGVPTSYPGNSLQIDSNGKYVRTIQSQLNAISNNYPSIPKVQEDGIYGDATANSVKIFQGIFGLPQTGVVDFKTWYEISRIYVATTKIASLNPVV